MEFYAFVERCAACLVQENGMHRIVGINQDGQAGDARQHFREKLQRLPLNSAVNRLSPVTFPPGRARLVIKPRRHGITDGDHDDGDIPSSRHGGNVAGVAAAMMMSTFSRTSSAARPGGVRAAIRPSRLERDAPFLHVAELPQTLTARLP